MSPEASKNIAVKQAHAHMCCEAELGPEPRTPGEWHWEGAVEDLREALFPQETKGEMCYSRPQTIQPAAWDPSS